MRKLVKALRERWLTHYISALTNESMRDSTLRIRVSATSARFRCDTSTRSAADWTTTQIPNHTQRNPGTEGQQSSNPSVSFTSETRLSWRTKLPKTARTNIAVKLAHRMSYVTRRNICDAYFPEPDRHSDDDDDDDTAPGLEKPGNRIQFYLDVIKFSWYVRESKMDWFEKNVLEGFAVFRSPWVLWFSVIPV